MRTFNIHTQKPFQTMQTINEPWGLIAGRTIATPRGDFSITKAESWAGKPVDLDNIARLCSAAPDLLSALESLLLRANSLEQSATHDGLKNCEALAIARSAIYKAKGGE